MSSEQPNNPAGQWFESFLRSFRKHSARPGRAVTARTKKGKSATVEYGKLESRQAMATIPMGGILDSNIAAAGEVDVHQFQATAGSNIELSIQSTATQAGFKGMAVLVAPGGTVLGTLYAGTTSAYRSFNNLPSTGTYSLRVSDDNFAQSGLYSIGLEGTRPISPGSSALIKGGIVSGSISRNLEKDQWTFTAAAGDIYELAVTSTATQSGYQTVAHLFAPSGTLVTTFFGNTTNFHKTLTLSETGTYMLQVSDNDLFQTGNYTIGLEGLKPISPGNIVLPRGSVLSGTITSALAKTQYTFSGEANGTYEIAITGTAIDSGYQTMAKLFSPAEALLRTFYSGTTNSAARFNLPQTGTYMLQISDNDLVQRGNFTVGLEGINPISLSPIALTKGAVASGTISGPIDKKQYTFAGTAGQVVDLAVSGTSSQSGYQTVAELFTSGGNLVTTLYSGTTNAWRRVTLPANGTYMLQVRDNNLTEAGNFKISFEGISPASPDALTPARNTVVNRSITDNMQRDQFLINRSAGQSFTLNLLKTSGGASFLPRYQVISPNGQVIGNFLAGTPRTFNATQSGTYLVLVYDDLTDNIGNYSFNWA